VNDGRTEREKDLEVLLATRAELLRIERRIMVLEQSLQALRASPEALDALSALERVRAELRSARGLMSAPLPSAHTLGLRGPAADIIDSERPKR
jgi:hypothetical protein